MITNDKKNEPKPANPLASIKLKPVVRLEKIDEKEISKMLKKKRYNMRKRKELSKIKNQGGGKRKREKTPIKSGSRAKRSRNM